MGQQTCEKCGVKGHSHVSCGRIDPSITGAERNSLLTSINAKANREERNEDVRRYRKKYPERVKESQKKTSDKLRIQALTAYGGICACCGFDDLTRKIHGVTFLSIDHIAGGGRKHAKTLKTNMYQWLRQQNYPEGFRVLCRGCNNSMEPNGTKCILHQE